MVIVHRLTLEEAAELTQKIRLGTEQLWELLWQAKEGLAWRVLGYESWGDYVRTEFAISKTHSYRLLHHGEIIHYLTEAARVKPIESDEESPMGDSISERQTRPIKHADLPRLTEAVREKVAVGTPPLEAVQETVSAFHRALEKATVEVISKDPIPDLNRVHNAIQRLDQGWELNRIADGIASVYGVEDVRLELDRMRDNLVILDTVVKNLREYLEV